MRIVVCLKHVPLLSSLRFDPATRRLVRDGVRGEPSAFDLRALLGALTLRDAHGGEVVALTMGPAEAAETLRHALALGADRAVHLSDRALAGSDTLATARALAAAIRREGPDLVLVGRSSVDAETGQVGPEIAELLGWPQATVVRSLTVDPAARTFEAERAIDEGFETVRGPLPALVTAAEDLAEERFPSKAERLAAAEKPIATLALADLDLGEDQVGPQGSPTWVAELEAVKVQRRGELLEGDDPAQLARRLGERLRELGAFAPLPEPPPLPSREPGQGPPLLVVAELGPGGPRAVTAELLAKASWLARSLRGPVEALLVGGEGISRWAEALAAAGADRVLVAEGAHLDPYTTEAHAAILTTVIRERGPRLVLVPSTVRGRDLAPRVAARLGLGLTGDAIDVDLDAEGRTRLLKPAFGGNVVAPVLSRTRPDMATIRPGVLRAARPDPSRRAEVVSLRTPALASRVTVVRQQALAAPVDETLDAAAVVLGIGKGVGEDGVASVRALAQRIGAAVCATREVTDLGWLARQYQVGLTGRAIAPRLYVGLGISGAMEHMVGLRRAGVIVAVNRSPKAPVFKGGCDVGVVADLHALLPHLETALCAGGPR